MQRLAFASTFAAFATVAAVGFLLAPRAAHASQCSGIQAEISNVTVEIVPAMPCLTFEVKAIGCGDDAAVVVVNSCGGSPVTLTAPLCQGDDTACTIPAGESLNTFPAEDPDGHVDANVVAEIDGADVQVHVTYDVEYVDAGGAEGDGCRAAPGAPSGRSGAGIALAIAAFVAFGAARRLSPSRA